MRDEEDEAGADSTHACGLLLHFFDSWIFPGDRRHDAARRDAQSFHQREVGEARDHDALAAQHTFVAGAGHGGGVHHHGALEEARRLEAGGFLELGDGRAGAEGRDGDARAGGLVGESLGEREHVRLGRVVDGHQRAGLEGGRRGDVEDPAAAARQHAGEEELGQVRQGGDVDLDHLEFLVEGRGGEGAVDAEAGVVDQGVDGEVAVGQLPRDLLRGVAEGEVRRQERDGDAELLLQARARSPRAGRQLRATKTRSLRSRARRVASSSPIPLEAPVTRAVGMRKGRYARGGRGSSAGSLVAALLGMTGVCRDPNEPVILSEARIPYSTRDNPCSEYLLGLHHGERAPHALHGRHERPGGARVHAPAGSGEGFSKKYNCHRLVYCESTDDVSLRSRGETDQGVDRRRRLP